MDLVENDNPKVLLVDDKAENITILLDMLEPLNLEIFVSLSAKDALKSVGTYDFDLILLDIVMPNMDGYEVCKILKNHNKHKDIPIIFISALGGVEDKIKGFSYGVDDYIAKPFLQEELIARVKLHLQKGLLFKSLKQLLRKSYHELYNPLTIINTSVEMQNLKHGNTRYTDSITVASNTLQLVYDDLYYSLSSRNHHENVLSIDLVKFVQKRIDYFYYFRKSKNINIDLQSFEVSKIQIREVDLYRIVDNTISNAIKYAKDGSTVSIDIINSNDSVIFKSSNIGSTINHPEKIFKQGYREDFENIGMGIGLEIVSSLCNTYNIKTEVISENGVTSFKYAIPKILN
ncbi:hybrid sensor histidine kinase/response regulator [Candidatus Sulfurimonas marisnigri]|uniref:Hybrid sensor histidine kinase/response regulator n=1 Tax=Candidatus Sulfurimonas marisnigri TaxID=2740405 RepID=A0A7S7M1I3_9BACT|nr:hybrid sensor histidine kinase/response regulator [Candidatus Sulfurimonas marisnigri]QOY55300.1 hybrid sensor histidine kinase/response regulator [Candidatus Sulfurimonas marisnigri]